ncbi:hypothetical protein [Cupriavidus pauculus]|uniref:hypothetical protein n=1 Tax=Cupriavidus pauculus TaxID=82633 RepID=UPI001EE30AD9|nr:hypothetical protein [Cupriavidus pauculus]GJG98517.1 hypothetical protein CBA19C6_28530 [Cupriavidus pauculus]
MENSLLELIDSALREIQPMAAQAFEPAVSIERQLNWCRSFECGLPIEPAPGPFSMGLIAVREFDMYGDMPELASLINKVQRLVEAKLARANEKS